MIIWKNYPKGHVNTLDTLREQKPLDIFQLSPDYTTEELKKAYRKKVKFYHPDGKDSFLTNHYSEIMKIINQAYEELKGQI